MRYNTLLAICLAMLIGMATSCRKAESNGLLPQEDDVVKGYEAQGDSTLYGLACDGCDEQHLVILFPTTGADPDTFDITDAMREGKVFGRPAIGDRMAISLSAEGSKQVSVAINLDDLTGTWVYDVMPELRHKIDDEILRKMSRDERARMDSIRDSLMVPREYGMYLKPDFTAQSLGMVAQSSSLEGESPVIYPEPKRYAEWHVYNGMLILTQNIPVGTSADGTVERKILNDTAQILTLRRDSLALRFGDTVQGYRLRPDTISDRK